MNGDVNWKWCCCNKWQRQKESARETQTLIVIEINFRMINGVDVIQILSSKNCQYLRQNKTSFTSISCVYGIWITNSQTKWLIFMEYCPIHLYLLSAIHMIFTISMKCFSFTFAIFSSVDWGVFFFHLFCWCSAFVWCYSCMRQQQTVCADFRRVYSKE